MPGSRAKFQPLDDPRVLARSEAPPVLDDSLASIPKSVKFECHSGADGVLAVVNQADGSCNSVFLKPRDVN